mmetsp:Transcript_33089/g.84113  ORF Transcript_33089/g.84113 Transcript_33089/m.84113 type:complete len:324 (-) Transcript_33089:389-1360(-)
MRACERRVPEEDEAQALDGRHPLLQVRRLLPGAHAPVDGEGVDDKEQASTPPHLVGLARARHRCRRAATCRTADWRTAWLGREVCPGSLQLALACMGRGKELPSLGHHRAPLGRVRQVREHQREDDHIKRAGWQRTQTAGRKVIVRLHHRRRGGIANSQLEEVALVDVRVGRLGAQIESHGLQPLIPFKQRPTCAYVEQPNRLLLPRPHAHVRRTQDPLLRLRCQRRTDRVVGVLHQLPPGKLRAAPFAEKRACLSSAPVDALMHPRARANVSRRLSVRAQHFVVFRRLTALAQLAMVPVDHLVDMLPPRQAFGVVHDGVQQR